MSSSIKPPGAAGTGGPTGPAASDDVRTAGSGAAFQEELAKAGTAGAPAGAAPATSAAATQRAELLRALADEIRSGQVDPKQAVDRLIERTLTTGPAAALPPARRVELEALLRAALEEDPTLQAMQRDLTRGR